MKQAVNTRPETRRGEGKTISECEWNWCRELK